ncbi:MAG: hypothetical protein KatS3mg077_1955 [Candidatus Binatia bacterium]|nr:MAG: hypothetical protein KatS3mg077_1955 [Candidatus Binatia bacterium]
MRATARRAAGFFVASLVFALSLGATLGAVVWLSLTLQVNLLGTVALAQARMAHAYAQLFGFTALFVCGVAYHVLPRLSGRPWGASLLDRVTLVGLSAGTALASIGSFAGPTSVGVLLGHASLLMGAGAFAWAVSAHLRAAQVSPALLSTYVQTGSWWLVFAAAAPLGFPALLARGGQAVWEAALWGFAANWIYGMSLRILPTALGLKWKERNADRVVWVLHQAGTVLWCAGGAAAAGALPVGFGTGASQLGGLALGLAGAAYIGRIGFLRGRGPVGHSVPGTERFLVFAYGWLAVSLASGPVAVAWTGASFIGPAADFARHAFTLGFLSQMIFGVSMRVLPAAAGIPIWSARLRDATYWLLNVGLLVRGGEAASAWGASPAWYRWAAVSGPVTWAAFLVFAVNLVMSVASHGRGGELRRS